jgi:hypothetical protein
MVLTTKFGKPFSPAGFGNYMSDIIAAAGLPERCVTQLESSVSHGDT